MRFCQCSRILGLPTLVLLSACHAPDEIPDGVADVYSETAIPSLRQRAYSSRLALVKKLPQSEGHTSALMSYVSDQLKVYALLSRPKAGMPQSGFPVVIFGHGFHPEPKDYGISKADGTQLRPGDYYRGVPEAYAERGFIVITPDYRGHGGSDGFEYTQRSYLSAGYYAIDVLNLLAALPSVDDIDMENVFYVGHSMGGDVGLRALLVTKKIKAASLWSPVIASTYQQALFYGRDQNGDTAITLASFKRYLEKVKSNLDSSNIARQLSSIDPINFVDELSMPLIVHHATGDVEIPLAWSENFVARLAEENKEFEFFSYQSDDHLFEGENRKNAIDRDVAFFTRFVARQGIAN